MLRRLSAHVSKLNFRIPRRGRIRFFSIIVIFALAVAFNKYKEAGASFTAPGGFKNELFKVAAKSGHAKDGFTLNTVAEVLRQNHPDLNCAADTLLWDDKKVVAYLSIDSSLQALGQKLMERYHPKYGALAAIDPATGRVLTMVSYTNKAETSLGDNLCCKALFPAASVFKTITASGAIEKGLLEAGSQLSLVGNRYSLHKYQLTENLRRARLTSLENAFAYSMNPVFGRIGIYVLGKEGLAEYIGKFGFNRAIPFELPLDPSVAAGKGDSILELAQLASGYNQQTKISPVYGAMLAGSICAQGAIVQPSVVDSLRAVDNGQCLYRARAEVWRTPIKAATAGEVMRLMTKVTEYGTARRSFRKMMLSPRYSDITFGGKTGTLDQDSVGHVDWFIGFAHYNKAAFGDIAIGVVTVHGPNWTVHSSFLAAEIFRKYIDKAESLARRKGAGDPDPALCAPHTRPAAPERTADASRP